MKWKKSADLIEKLQGRELAVIHLKSGEIFVLKAVSKLVWESLSEESTVEGLAAAICKRFDTSTRQAKSDVTQLLSDFEEAGMVTVNK